MALQARPRFTFEDYLASERDAEVRHEYVDGQVFNMVGASAEHNIIVANLTSALVSQLKGYPCLVFSADMKLRIESADACKYPDLMALCGECHFVDGRRDVLQNPSLIIEVLSASTEAYDRGEKFAIYRRISSLCEYVLVSQERKHVELFAKQKDGGWLLTEYSSMEDVVSLTSVHCTLSVREIYDKVESFENATNPDLIII
jgi:Uma2 family endonuclease